MEQKSFESSYVTNDIRTDIYGEFLVYLATVEQYLSTYTLLVFGSFVGEKDKPSDIDLLLHGYVKDSMLDSFRIEKLHSCGQIHVKLEVSAIKSNFKLRSNQELVDWFEVSNSGKKVGKYEAINF